MQKPEIREKLVMDKAKWTHLQINDTSARDGIREEMLGVKSCIGIDSEQSKKYLENHAFDIGLYYRSVSN